MNLRGIAFSFIVLSFIPMEFSTAVGQDAEGGMTSYVRYSYDRAGNTSMEVTYGSSGADGTWFTPDDSVGGYRTYAYDGKRRVLEEKHFFVLGHGPDGKWFTADDKSWSHFRYAYDRQGRIDGKWDLDASGNKRSFYEYEYDQNNDMTKEVHLYPGFDKKFHTADDELADSTIFIRATTKNGFPMVRAIHIKPQENLFADDQEDLFADDMVNVITAYSSTVYDGQGKELQRARIENPGPDARWQTQDDIILDVTSKRYDDQGRLVEERIARDPGPDGQWGTEDDVLMRKTIYSYDADGRLTMSRAFSGR